MFAETQDVPTMSFTQEMTLNKREQAVERAFLKELPVLKRRTAEPLVVAMVGLVGSGKSSVARELGKHLKAVVVSADSIRVELRKKGQPYDHVHEIAEDLAESVLEKGGNVVLDSDFADTEKRVRLKAKASSFGARIVYVRTFCDLDVALGRIMNEKHADDPADFFGGASSPWKGPMKGNVVKAREMHRLTRRHYYQRGVGPWRLKKLHFHCHAALDTTEDHAWKEKIPEIAKKLSE